jgi:hypothetical protein
MILFSVRFADICPRRVMKSKTPVGRPKTNPKNPDTKVITIVSNSPLKIIHTIGSDIA